MNKFIATVFACVLSVLGLGGCANSYTETTETPVGTRSVQRVSNGFSSDTVIRNDTARAYWERCMANRAQQMGSAQADRECTAEGTYGPMGGYGGYGGYLGGGFVVDTYGAQAARLASPTGLMPVGPTGQAYAGSMGGSLEDRRHLDAHAKVLADQEGRLRKLEEAKKRSSKK